MEELRRCPFCGGQAEWQMDDNGYYIIGCDTLGCYCNMLENDLPTFPILEYAVSAWNRREFYPLVMLGGEK